MNGPFSMAMLNNQRVIQMFETTNPYSLPKGIGRII